MGCLDHLVHGLKGEETERGLLFFPGRICGRLLRQGGNAFLYFADQVQKLLYILVLTQSDLKTRDFNRICNMLSEYGSLEKASSASLAFLEEHCEMLVSGDAVQQLAEI